MAVFVYSMPIMKIAYHFTIPRPPQPELDAAIQDALKLLPHFPGELNYLYPAATATRLVPRFLCGLHQLGYLAKLDQEVKLHQIYSNEFYPYPILYRFTKPIVYTIVTSLKSTRRPWFAAMLKPVSQFVVSNVKDQAILQSWGFNKVQVIPPGIDLTQFTAAPASSLLPNIDEKFVLLAGSAPWSLGQFESKGIDLLLQSTTTMPNLHLILLWRGMLFEEIQQRVAQARLADRVEIINQRIKVNELLPRVHACIVLAKTADLIKAYPHSLLEALAMGKPVLVSDGLALADYVREQACGLVLSEFSLNHLVRQLTELQQNYALYRQRAAALDLRPFSQEHLIQAYRQLYKQLM